jgi:hypothetical protein
LALAIFPGPSTSIDGALIVCGLPCTAQAQASRVEVSGGYSLVVDERSDLNPPVGWVAGVAGRITTWLAIAGEVGANYKTTNAAGSDLQFRSHSSMAGVRASGRTGKFVEFGQVLAGIVHARATAFDISSSRTVRAIQAGIGLDYAINRKLTPVFKRMFDSPPATRTRSNRADSFGRLRASSTCSAEGCAAHPYALTGSLAYASTGTHEQNRLRSP